MKLPFDLSLKFAFRVLLPGLVVGLALLPVMQASLTRLHVEAYQEIVFVAVALAGGWVILLLDMTIYMLYEGRRFWPPGLRRFCTGREQARLKRLLTDEAKYRRVMGEAQSVLEKEEAEHKLREAWFDIRRFPLDSQGRPTVASPTRLGNLLAAFEDYPKNRYGLDSVFYWSRLWVQLDKDLREELDSSQAQADSALYTSFALFCLGVAFLLYSVCRAAGLTGLAGVDYQPPLALLLIALAGWLGGYFLYRLGLHAQAAYGEYFKAIFDLNQSKLNLDETVKQVADILEQPDLAGAPLRDRRKTVWRYLQYYQVRPPGEERSIPVPEYLKRKALNGVPETYLAPLYWKAMESQRPDAMIKDDKAVALVRQMSLDFSRVRQIRMTQLLYAMRLIFTREMDRYARDFLSRYPEAVVVHIGCGLDSRFERVDNGQVEWFDLDLPGVIELRRKFIGDEGERYHLLGCSALEPDWLEAVKACSPRPCLFLAETVFVYFAEAQVKSLVLTLRDHFPGAELVFDGWRPFEVWLGNRYLSNSPYAGLMRWGIWRGQQIERWGDGIHLLDEWGFFDQPEPRLDSFRWMAPLFRLFKPMRLFHFQLGEAGG